jgi:vacuolar-type H+-ATPase subunit H
MRNQEVLTLTKKIDRIFEQVYSMNESLSVESRRQMILGFEDGINERFGILGNIGGKIHKALIKGSEKVKSTYNAMVSKGQEYYEKGKKLAGDAWNAMLEFGKKVLSGIEQGYKKAVESVVSSYNSFVESVKSAHQSAVNSIVEAYGKMKNKAEAFKEYFKGLYNDILAKTVKLIQDTKSKMVEAGEKTDQWFASNKAAIEKTISDAKQSGIDSMNQLGDMGKKVLEKGKKVTSDIFYLSLLICAAPIILIVEGIQKAPEIYDSAIEMTKNFINTELAEIRENYRKEMAKESFRHISTFENFKY